MEAQTLSPELAAALPHVAVDDERQTDIEDTAQLGKRPENEATVARISADRLRGFVERLERLAEEKAELSGEMRDVMEEAKSAGFDVKAIRQILRDRKATSADREAFELLLDTYRVALGL